MNENPEEITNNMDTNQDEFQKLGSNSTENIRPTIQPEQNQIELGTPEPQFETFLESEEEEKIIEQKVSNSDQAQQNMMMQLGFMELHRNMSEMQRQLRSMVDSLKGQQNNDLSSMLEKNLDLMNDKLEEMKEASKVQDTLRVFQLTEEIKEIVVESSGPLQEMQPDIIEDLSRVRMQTNEQSISPKRQKRTRLIKSKQALSQFKKGIIYVVMGVHYFFKNPENIVKCFVVAVSCFFMTSYMSIPDMGNRHSLYLLDWLAYNRSSRSVLTSGSLCLISFEWYLIYYIWVFCCGLQFEADSQKIRTLINECNPLLQLSLVFMTDNDLINNKFDLAVWFCNVFFYSTIRVYYLQSLQIIKKTLSNLTMENINQISCFNKIHQFSSVILVINAIYTITGILMFRKVGFYALSLLYYGGVSCFLEYFKIWAMTRSLHHNYTYYTNNNIDMLNEPFFFQEISIDSFYHALRILYCLQLIANYFRTVSLQFVLHLWLFYLMSDLQTSVSSLKRYYDLFRTQRKVQANLDMMFPRTDPTQLQPDEICTICHDELLCSRTLQCGHKFHLKCLFNWLKNQQQCPMCRQQIDNVIQGDQPPSLLGRILQMLSIITLFNITIYFQPGRNNEPPNIQVQEPVNVVDPQPQLDGNDPLEAESHSSLDWEEAKSEEQKSIENDEEVKSQDPEDQQEESNNIE